MIESRLSAFAGWVAGRKIISSPRLPATAQPLYAQESFGELANTIDISLSSTMPTIRANRQVAATSYLRLPVRRNSRWWPYQAVEVGRIGGCWSPLKPVVSYDCDTPSTFASRLALKCSPFLRAEAYQQRRTQLKGVEMKSTPGVNREPEYETGNKGVVCFEVEL